MPGSTAQTNKYHTFYLQQRAEQSVTWADIKVNHPLDYESIKEYNLTIRVEVRTWDFKLCVTIALVEENSVGQNPAEIHRNLVERSNRDRSMRFDAYTRAYVSHLLRLLQNNGAQQLASEATVHIMLEDVNDEIPLFTEREQETVLEGEPIRSKVTQVNAIDKDGTFPNNQVSSIRSTCPVLCFQESIKIRFTINLTRILQEFTPLGLILIASN